MFQSTRPRGARHPANELKWSVYSFNPRAHVGRDPLVSYRGRPIIDSFNPRAHVGRDTFASSNDGSSIAVSIHAPTWGATVFL